MHREYQGSGVAFWLKVILALLLLKILFSSGIIWVLLLGGAIWYAIKSGRFNGYFDGGKRKHTVRIDTYEGNGKVKNDEVVIL